MRPERHLNVLNKLSLRVISWQFEAVVVANHVFKSVCYTEHCLIKESFLKQFSALHDALFIIL